MMWIATVYMKNSEHHLVKRVEFVTRRKYTIDEFILDVNKQAAAVCRREKAIAEFEIIRVDLDHYIERYSL